MTEQAQGWANAEFGYADLGDRRRVSRLVDVAWRVASNPAGKVTEVFTNGAEREAAFRLLENDNVSEDALMDAAHQSGARRCVGCAFAYVPIDQSSLHLTDRQNRKGLGGVGTNAFGARGLQVMSAIGVSPDGTPQGIVGQKFWARERDPIPKGERDRAERRRRYQRNVKDKETHRWLEVMAQVTTAFAAVAPETRPWFQLDRGGDAWSILLAGIDPRHWFTVRASSNRRLDLKSPGPRRYLWETLEQQQSLGYYELEVPDGPHRTGRVARIEIRATRVSLALLHERARNKQHGVLEVWTVLAREAETTPADESPIEWMLLTNHEADTLEKARQVVLGYSQRWRIEEFHKTWKSGACRVEENQLRQRDHVIRWAVILASVAMRIQRLTHLARHKPEDPATVELTPVEIQAITLLVRPKRYVPGTVPTIAQAVQWLAQAGGYTGKSSGGPPGALVIARGLRRIEPVVEILLGDALDQESAGRRSDQW